MVTSLLGSTGWGVDSLALGCSDGSVTATTGNPDRELYRKVTCSSGLNNIQVFQGASCGVGTIKTWCKGALITGTGEGSYGTNKGCWKGLPVQTGYKCTPPSKIVGVEGTYGVRFNGYDDGTYVTSIDTYICSK
jgi:hypothetical protein